MFVVSYKPFFSVVVIDITMSDKENIFFFEMKDELYLKLSGKAASAAE